MFRRLPGEIRVVVLIVAVLITGATGNWLYQVSRKPTELLFPVSGALHKLPADTWRAYGHLFERHSTDTISPEFLAALAQIEASGNPVARTYWRFSLTPNLFEIWRPASSAVGMYQITDGTFEIARQFCIRNHRVARIGPWHDLDSCWFNTLYARVWPGDAIEMTAALLDHQVRGILARTHAGGTSAAAVGVRARQHLAAIIHLCGAGAAARYAAAGLQFSNGQRCGDHNLAVYLARLDRMLAVFHALRNDRSY